MESKVNYTLVGVFVLLMSSLLIAFAFWLGKYNDSASAYAHYKVYLTESVAGLAPEAAVKFHGVDMGKVASKNFSLRSKKTPQSEPIPPQPSNFSA